MNQDVYLHSFRSVLPPYSLPQDQTVEWVLKAHWKREQLNGSTLSFNDFSHTLRRFALSGKQILRRFYECPDIDEDWESHEIYHLTEASPDGATIGKRNDFFQDKVQRVLKEVYSNTTPSQLVHVTCTGYVSPSPAQVFFGQREVSPAITHAYHMGCYASLPAVRMARGLAISENNDVDVFHTEMCSLHLAPSLHTPEQIVVQTLFSDGHIKYSVGKKKGRGLKVLSIKEKLLPGSVHDMTWVPDAYGMKMALSKEVPFKIRDNLFSFLSDLCQEANVKVEEILKEAIFAVHPGGPKIIEAVQKKLELSQEQISASKKVFFERGNMSSATLPHVWDTILSSSAQEGTKVLSLAFGPGLTIFGGLFEVSK